MDVARDPQGLFVISVVYRVSKDDVAMATRSMFPAAVAGTAVAAGGLQHGQRRKEGREGF